MKKVYAVNSLVSPAISEAVESERLKGSKRYANLRVTSVLTAESNFKFVSPWEEMALS